MGYLFFLFPLEVQFSKQFGLVHEPECLAVYIAVAARSGRSLRKVHRPICLCQELGAIFCTKKLQDFFRWLRGHCRCCCPFGHPRKPSPSSPPPDRRSLFWGAGRGTGGWNYVIFKVPFNPNHSMNIPLCSGAANRWMLPRQASASHNGVGRRGILWLGGARGTPSPGTETPLPNSDGLGHALSSPSEATSKCFYLHLPHAYLQVPDHGFAFTGDSVV